MQLLPYELDGRIASQEKIAVSRYSCNIPRAKWPVALDLPHLSLNVVIAQAKIDSPSIDILELVP